MSITGKNFLLALFIAFILTAILTLVYSVMGTFLFLDTRENVNLSTIINHLIQSFVGFFRLVGMCFAPVILLLSFALLQRFRIKDNLTANTDIDET